MKNVISGSFSGTGSSASTHVLYGYNVSVVFGSATGTILVRRSFDNGVTWLTVNRIIDTDEVHEWVGVEPERGVIYKLECISKGGTGPITYRLGSDGLAVSA